MTGTVRAERDGSAAWVIIDNPERRNALSGAMFAALAHHFRELDSDPTVRVIILRGAGDRAFAAGADISDIGSGIQGSSGQPTYDVATPVVAMIHGACIGGGLLLALTSDIRIAADDAKFGIPASRLGVAYPYDGVRRLVAAAGPAAAGEILLGGRTFGADDALRWGIVSRVVAKADLDATVREVATAVAAGAPLTARASKSAIRAAVAGSPPDAVADAEAAASDCWSSEDLREGQQAFVEKRAPVFKGR